MNTRLGAMALGMFLTIGSWGLAQSTNPTATDNPRITELIRKLGSSSFAERDRARKELEGMSIEVLDVLRRASKTANVETKRRLEELIRHAEDQLLTRQVLSAKEIHLKLADANLDQALAEIAKLSGYAVQFNGDRTVFANKKFTLDTGKTSFWQALDQFCNKAGMIEKIEAPAPYNSTVKWIGKGRNKVTAYVSPPPAPPSPIVLMARGQEKVFASYSGAVKSQLRVVRDQQTKEWLATFILSVEPRLSNTSLVGAPVIIKGTDQRSQQLTISEDATLDQTMPQREVQIRLKDTDDLATQLKELTGKLTMQVDLSNDVLAKMEHILDATGKNVAGANGGTLLVNSIRKDGDEIEMQVTMENLTPNPFGNNVIIRGGNVVIRGNINVKNVVIGPNGVRIDDGTNGNTLPDLLDAKGQKYKIASSNSDGINFVNGSCTQTVTIRYSPNAGQAAPSELVLFGIRTHTIAVPFRFENIPLP